jgi:hypothetical protein
MTIGSFSEIANPAQAAQIVVVRRGAFTDAQVILDRFVENPRE